MSVSEPFVPSFDAPFRIGPDGLVATVEQGSAADIGAQVYNVLICPQGAKLNDPGFGISSPLFDQMPIDGSGIEKSVMAQVPGALDVSVRQISSAGGLVTIPGPISGPGTFSSETLISGDTVTILIGDPAGLVTLAVEVQVQAS